jgi:hypothetical protein
VVWADQQVMQCCNTTWHTGPGGELAELRCPGETTLRPGSPTYLCDTCGAMCGRYAHPKCDVSLAAVSDLIQNRPREVVSDA